MVYIIINSYATFMKTKQRDPNTPFVFTSTPPSSADKVLSSRVVLDKNGEEKAVVEETKRDFHRYDGMSVKDFSIRVLQQTNPSALAMVNGKLQRDKISSVSDLENKVADMSAKVVEAQTQATLDENRDSNE